ncbi:MAG TPA: hypothetical protein VEO91_09190 [Candidatus Limnocylindria bacterium]|nr:hypothetical protein [Candidatus Limnocylindria bacterium]
MRRAVAFLSTAMLLFVAFPVPSASAADSTHISLSRTGAIVAFAEIHDGLWVFTELSASSQASRDIVTGPFLWINQAAWAPDETGEYNLLVWSLGGSTTEFSMTIDDQLAAASVSAAALPVDRCDADGICIQGTASVDASFTAVGSIQHSHQRSIGSVSHESLFIYNSVASDRFATASVTVDGLPYGPTTGPSDANIYDTRTGSIDVTLASPGTRAALPAGVTIGEKAVTPTGRQTGESMFAGWASDDGVISRFSFLGASTQQFSLKGTVVNRKSVGYSDQVYGTDEFGRTTLISATEGFDEDSTATIFVDRSLSTGVLAGAVIPATSCTYIDDEVLCIDTVVNAEGQWTGIGSTSKTRDGDTFTLAGVIVIVYRNVSTHREATATATIDGDAFTGSVGAALDRSSIGFHEVHIGG